MNPSKMNPGQIVVVYYDYTRQDKEGSVTLVKNLQTFANGDEEWEVHFVGTVNDNVKRVIYK